MFFYARRTEEVCTWSDCHTFVNHANVAGFALRFQNSELPSNQAGGGFLSVEFCLFDVSYATCMFQISRVHLGCLPRSFSLCRCQIVSLCTSFGQCIQLLFELHRRLFQYLNCLFMTFYACLQRDHISFAFFQKPSLYRFHISYFFAVYVVHECTQLHNFFRSFRFRQSVQFFQLTVRQLNEF